MLTMIIRSFTTGLMLGKPLYLHKVLFKGPHHPIKVEGISLFDVDDDYKIVYHRPNVG